MLASERRIFQIQGAVTEKALSLIVPPRSLNQKGGSDNALTLQMTTVAVQNFFFVNSDWAPPFGKPPPPRQPVGAVPDGHALPMKTGPRTRR